MQSKVSATTILTAVFISQIAYEYFLIIGIIIIITINVYFIILLIQQIIGSYSSKFTEIVDDLKINILHKFPQLNSIIKVSRKRIVKERWKLI